MPPSIRAVVLGVGSGTFCGNRASSNAMVEGIFLILWRNKNQHSQGSEKSVHRSSIPFLRTTAFRGVAGVAVPTARLFLPRDFSGVAYGGGAMDRAASQSKGTEEEMDGVSAGERWRP